MITLKVTLPLKISTNPYYRLYWRKKHEVNNLYYNYFIDKKYKIDKYPVEITYRFTFKSRPLDSTNCSAMVKMIEDALIKNGTLKDDSPKYVKGTHIYSEKGERDDVEITIK